MALLSFSLSKCEFRSDRAFVLGDIAPTANPRGAQRAAAARCSRQGLAAGRAQQAAGSMQGLTPQQLQMAQQQAAAQHAAAQHAAVTQQAAGIIINRPNMLR